MKRFTLACATLAFALLPALAAAQSVLIINGATGTSEPSTTSLITNNLEALHIAAGNTVTIADGVPVSFGGFTQVWDLRFTDSQPITAPEETQFLTYLQGGGRVFAMGENAFFPTRNASIFSLIGLAGGGTLGFDFCNSSTQTISAPFTGPNAVASVDFLAPGCFNGKGTGEWIANSGSNGAGIAWGPGSLANATAGTLTTILDVNFMQGNIDDDSQNLTKNLIGFVNNPTLVPEPSTYALMATGLLAIFAMSRRRRSATKS